MARLSQAAHLQWLVLSSQASAYDNSQYGNYNQQSALKAEFQPAPKYNAGNAQHAAAGHAAYGAHSHAAGQAFAANTAAASTSAPLAATPAGQQQVSLPSLQLCISCFIEAHVLFGVPAAPVQVSQYVMWHWCT